MRGISTRRVGNFSEQDWGELRERGHRGIDTKGRKSVILHPCIPTGHGTYCEAATLVPALGPK
jgi:hypothetical protein